MFGFECYTETVFSPGHGLAGFPQEKLRWRIKRCARLGAEASYLSNGL